MTTRLCRQCFENYEAEWNLEGQLSACPKNHPPIQDDGRKTVYFGIFDAFTTRDLTGTPVRVSSGRENDRLCAEHNAIPYLDSKPKERHEAYQKDFEKLQNLQKVDGVSFETGGLEQAEKFMKTGR